MIIFYISLGYKCPAGIDQSEYNVSILSQRDSMRSTEERSLKISEAFLRSSYYKLPTIDNDQKDTNDTIDPTIQTNSCK